MNNKRLIDIIEKFAGKRIRVIGDVLLDVFYWGKARENLERPVRPLITVHQTEYRLGGAANVACNLASLGTSTYLYGKIGSDANGHILSELCESRGIFFFPLIGCKTILKNRLMDQDFHDYIARFDIGEAPGEITPITENDSDYVIHLLTQHKKSDALIASDYNKGMFMSLLGQKLVNFSKERNLPLFVDPKPVNAMKFSGATLIRPNYREATEIIGEKEIPREKIASRLQQKLGSKYSAVTCGSEGMVVYDGHTHVIPTYTREVADVTGAGDTVIAALALALTSGATLVEAAHIANYAAGIVVEKPGTATVSLKELIDRIKQSK
jgi:rfaE bifunctional protein kinase chain/domain